MCSSYDGKSIVTKGTPVETFPLELETRRSLQMEFVRPTCPLIKEGSYPWHIRCDCRLSLCLLKSSSNEQIRQIHNAWLYGIAALQRHG